MKDVLFKTFDTEIKQDASARRMTFKITSGDVDRDGDVIEPKGWDLAHYKNSPVVMWAHDYKQLPVAKTIHIQQTDDSLIATAEFPQKGVYPFADTVYTLLKEGYLSATSVGFKPLEYEPLDPKKGTGMYIKRQQLLEFSIVPIPANPHALVMQRAAGSDETKEFQAPLLDWCEKFLESSKGKGQWVVGMDLSSLPTKQDLADIHKALTMFKDGIGDGGIGHMANCPMQEKCPTPANGNYNTCTMKDKCPMQATMMPKKAGMGGEDSGSSPGTGDGMGGEGEGEEADNTDHMAGCTMGNKCPTPSDGHPDMCKKGDKCPLKAQNLSGGQASVDEEDVLAGIEFPVKKQTDEFVFDDEMEHILFGVSEKEISTIVRAAIKVTLDEQIKQCVRSEVQYAAGRLD